MNDGPSLKDIGWLLLFMAAVGLWGQCNGAYQGKPSGYPDDRGVGYYERGQY